MSLPPGTRLGAYDVVSLLGAGGMGQVYRARPRAGPIPAAVLMMAPVHDAVIREAGEPALGCPADYGELLKLGIDVCQATVAKYNRFAGRHSSKNTCAIESSTSSEANDLSGPRRSCL